jgi:phosphohistidine phosphatase
MSTVWFVRHAEAVEADEFSGPDLARPLTARGRRLAGNAYKQLAAARSGPSVVISSKAVRATETADLFCDAFKIKKRDATAKLNPGCSFREIRTVALAALEHSDSVALIGHEPDFSDAISRWTSGGKLSLKMKKGAVAELELNENQTGTLTMLVPPDVLGNG